MRKAYCILFFARTISHAEAVARSIAQQEYLDRCVCRIQKGDQIAHEMVESTEDEIRAQQGQSDVRQLKVL